MGAGSSAPAKPPPPPRISRKISGTTLQLQHLPPLITAPAREGIQTAAEARHVYLSRQFDSPAELAAHLSAAHDKLAALILAAHKAGNFRDYLSLLIEKAVLGLSTKSGQPSLALIEIACLVNPFLNREREMVTMSLEAQDGLSASERALGALKFDTAFRPADLEHVAEEEKDILVLLYYSCSISACADEAMDFVARVMEKMGTQSKLETRKEDFSETEIYVFWTTAYITTFLASQPGTKLSALGASKLQVEEGTNLHRLLTVCDMLVKEHRLDQVCFLLEFLEIEAYSDAKPYYRRHVARIAKEMKKKKTADRVLMDWHLAMADRILGRLKQAKDTAKERWGWKAGVRVSLGDAEFELHKIKKD